MTKEHSAPQWKIRTLTLSDALKLNSKRKRYNKTTRNAFAIDLLLVLKICKEGEVLGPPKTTHQRSIYEDKLVINSAIRNEARHYSPETLVWIVGNKAKELISKRVFQENKVCQIFQKTNISCPLIRT